ncbi:AMP-binding protein [Streptomyces sp. Tue6028]|uniref:AMP-binding protein n=1 Tax=Streptomyces sp. Tue6028 TaxID=2036037 RepID=UPI003EB90589
MMKPWAEATVLDVFESAVRDRPRGEAVVCGSERLSYEDLDAQVDGFAQGLRELGVTGGDRVAVWMVNRTEWLVTYFAVARLGAVLVALNPRYTVDECRHVLDASRAKAVVMQDRFRRHDYLDALRSLCPEIDAAGPGRWSSVAVPSLREVVVVGETGARGTRSFFEVAERGRRSLDAGEPAPRADVSPDDMFLLLYTSGTTSRSKGVMLSHRNIVANNFLSGERQRLTPEDRMLFVLPLASAFSCAHGLIAILSHHGTFVLLDSFSAPDCMRLIEQERCTTMYGVASMFQDIIDAPERPDYDLGSLRTGVGILTPEVAAAIREELGVPEYHNGWGMTESGGVSTMTSVADPVEVRTATVGTPLPGVELKIADPGTGTAVAEGEAGEVLVRGTAVTQGYYQDLEATEALIDEDGWLHSADLGQVLPGGYLKYLGRLKDLIKPNGFSVSPAEIETVLSTLPGIKTAAVVGVPDRRTMEAVFAFVVRDPAAQEPLDTEAVREHCARRLAGYKIPKYVEFLEDDLPRNDLGKVLKNRLREDAARRISAGAAGRRFPRARTTA